MRWSELAKKELIDLEEGRRFRRVGDLDLEFDPETGVIERLVVPPRLFGWLSRGSVGIPWQAIRRVGPDVVIVHGGEGRPHKGERWSQTR